MADKVTRKKPIQQLQQLRKIAYQPVQANSDAVSASSQSGHQQRQGAVIEELQLEKVIGTSSKGSNSLQVNPVTGDVCYIAGSRLIIYSPKDAKQIKFLPSRTQRPFQCIKFSSDGKYLAAGESAFRLPQVVIWEILYEDIEQVSKGSIARQATSMSMSESVSSVLQANVMRTQSEATISSSREGVTFVKRAVSYTEVSHLQGHKYGIEAVLFAPGNEFLITLGDPNDRGLFVWDWRKEKKISQNLLSKPALHVEISPKQDFFVTCGFQHLKLWHLNAETGMPDVRRPNQKSPPIIQAQSVDLTKVKLQIFVGIAIEWPKIFVLASDGHIYVFDKRGKLIKWMNIKVPRAFGCSAQEGRLYCACSDGIIRIFTTDSLQHLLSLSKPPPLGSTNLQAGNSRIRIQQNKTNKFADVIAVTIDKVNKRAVALYSDRMMFVWDVAELKTVTVLRSMYSHSGPIHDIQVVDNAHPLGLNSKATSRLRCENEDNLTKFVTCSSDRTIRFWNFIDQGNLPSHKHYQEIYQCLAKNAYSKDMSQMIFIVSALRESQETVSGQKPKTPFDHFKAGPIDRNEEGQLIDIKDQSGINLNEMVDSIRCIRVSPDGSELASGDEVGNIRIHSLKTTDFAQKRYLESHDSEVISLAYSSDLPPQSSSSEGNRFMLASGGRDKQVLLYDSDNNYEVFMNLDYHTSTITSLAFNESEDADGVGISLISSSADKSLVSNRLDNGRFHAHQGNLQLAGTDEDDPLFRPEKTQLCKDKVMSLDVAATAQYAVSGHDKSLCLWRLPTFERVWEKRVGAAEKDLGVGRSTQSQQAGISQVQLRVLIDRYASVVVSSSTSKRVTIYEAASGKPLCRAQPGQITTAMCFSNNMRHLITTSDNGIIFIWRLPEKLAQCLQQIKNESQRLEAAIERTPSIIEEEDEGDDEVVENNVSLEKVTQNHQEVEDINFDEVLDIRPESSQTDPVSPSKKTNTDFKDSTIVRRMQEVDDVLDLVSEAANFVDELYRRETPKIKKRKAAIDGANETPSALSLDLEDKEESKEPQYDVDAQEVCVQTLDEMDNATNADEEETVSIADGEQEINEVDPVADRALLRKLEAMNYQKRFTNYNDEDSNLRFRRSSEVLGRRSITSALLMRRSQAYIPELDHINNQQNSQVVQQPLSTSSRRSGGGFFDRERRDYDMDNQNTKKTENNDPVTDIVNDNQDILQTKKPTNPPQQDEDFAATLKQHNIDAHKSFNKSQSQRAAWGETNVASPGRRSSNKNMHLQGKPIDTRPTYIGGDMHGQQIDTRPTHVTGMAITDKERKRSPIKRFADKLFGRSPDKKRIGNVQHVQLQSQASQKKQMPNVGKYQIDGDYITSPSARSAQALPRNFNEQQFNQNKVYANQLQSQNSPKKSPVKSPQKQSLAQSQHTGTTVPLPESLNQQQPLQNQHQQQLQQQQNQFKPMFKRPNSVLDQQQSSNPLGTPLIVGPESAKRQQQQVLKTNDSPTTKTSAPAARLEPDGVVFKSQSHVVELAQERRLSSYISEEQRFNQQLQVEVGVINKALVRINQLTSLQKQRKQQQQKQQQQQQQQKQKVDDSQMTARRSLLTDHMSNGDVPPPMLTINDLSSSAMPSMRVHDTVSAILFKTMNQWNTMLRDLQASTDFDIDKLSLSFQGPSSDQNLLSRLDSSRSGFTSESQKQQQQKIAMGASQISRATIQEDARELLDKYSQLLLESFQSKMATAQATPQPMPPPISQFQNQK